MTMILTPQTAPRTLEGLAEIKPSDMRQLTENYLKGIRTDAEKLAWFDLRTPEAKAQYMLTLLQRWDAENGGPPAQAPTGVRAPVTNGVHQPAVAASVPDTQTVQVPPQAQMPPSVATVAPTALAAAQAAVGTTVDTKSKGSRSPRTTSSEAPPDLAANVLNLLTRVLETLSQVDTKIEALKAHVDTRLEEASSAKSSRLEKAIDESNSTVASLLKSISYMQQYALMSLLQDKAIKDKNSVAETLRVLIMECDDFQGLVDSARGKVG